MSLLDSIRRKRQQQQDQARATLAELAEREARGQVRKGDENRLAELVGDDEALGTKYETLLAECRELVEAEQTAARYDGAEQALEEGKQHIEEDNAEQARVIEEAEHKLADNRRELERLRADRRSQKQAEGRAADIRKRLAREAVDFDPWAERDLSGCVLVVEGESGPRANAPQPSGPHVAVPAEVYETEMARRRNLLIEAQAHVDTAVAKRVKTEGRSAVPAVLQEVTWASLQSNSFDPEQLARKAG